MAADERVQRAVRDAARRLNGRTRQGRAALAQFIADMRSHPDVDEGYVMMVSVDYRYLLDRHLINETFRRLGLP